MCGIVGIFRYKQITDIDGTINTISKMLIESETRGTDATGISIINSDTNKIEIYKKPLRARDFVKIDEWKEMIRNFGGFNILLGHTRNATHGTTENPENNHPFFDKKANAVMMHNGIVSNHKELYHKHKIKQVGECDSKIILDLFCKTKNINDPIKQIHGSMAFALYHNEKLYLFKDYSPLSICFNTENKTFYFASEIEFIQKSLLKKHLIMGLFPVHESSPRLLKKEFESDELVTINFGTRKAYSRIVDSDCDMDNDNNGTTGFVYDDGEDNFPTTDENKNEDEDEDKHNDKPYSAPYWHPGGY